MDLGSICGAIAPPPADSSCSQALLSRLTARTAEDPDYWDFRALRSRSGNHALFQYPAMMVPELQGALLDDLLAVEPGIRLVYDPFAGSGTTMLESLYRGLDFHGSDINPLAVLLCQVKARPPRVSEAKEAVAGVLAKARRLRRADAPSFPGIDKWFKPEVCNGLGRLRRAIVAQDSLDTRRFLWVCLAETVRLVSNSRTSTFKLHTYTREDIDRRESDALKVFQTVGEANARRLDEHWTRIARACTEESAPVETLLSGSATNPWIAPRQADVLMTSPPYGDNKTTVPYGQHSYLPLRWIDHDDIPGGFDTGLLDSTSRIDSLSLGGSLVGADDAEEALVTESPSLALFLPQVAQTPSLRKKTLAFCRDYSQALGSITSHLREGAYCFLTLGERRIGGHRFPLVAITRELLEAQDHETVTVIDRALLGSRKRMAAKNSEGETMAKESILVTRVQRTQK